MPDAPFDNDKVDGVNGFGVVVKGHGKLSAQNRPVATEGGPPLLDICEAMELAWPRRHRLRGGRRQPGLPLADGPGGLVRRPFEIDLGMVHSSSVAEGLTHRADRGGEDGRRRRGR